jgi:hypothetical protein
MRKKPGTTEKGKQRSFAFENLVESIQPGSIKISLITSEFKPISGTKIKMSTGGKESIFQSDEEGTFSVPKSSSKFKLSSVSKDNSAAQTSAH